MILSEQTVLLLASLGDTEAYRTLWYLEGATYLWTERGHLYHCMSAR